MAQYEKNTAAHFDPNDAVPGLHDNKGMNRGFGAIGVATCVTDRGSNLSIFRQVTTIDVPTPFLGGPDEYGWWYAVRGGEDLGWGRLIWDRFGQLVGWAWIIFDLSLPTTRDDPALDFSFEHNSGYLPVLMYG